MKPEKSLKILILGDDTASVELLKLELSPLTASTPPACSINQMEWMVFAEKPEIILLDLSSSMLNGANICTRLHEITTIPIMVLSVSNDPDYVAAILNAGADDFLSKPASFDILLARINKILRRTTQYSQAVAF